VFSFWASPFSRPAGVVVDASARCDAHWAAVNYSNPSGAVVHMFHSGLWGGWMFAVDSVDTAAATNGAAAAATTNDAAAAAAAAMPGDMILQLKADALLGTLADGAAVSAWPNSAPRAAGAHGAAQALAAKQPVFRAASWPGALPQVSFAGAQALSEASLPLPAQSTLFAAVRDTGSRTDYCSGVFYSAGADKSVCTRAATAGAPGADDDPPPAGAAIIATALDWGGSPADPGHRDLRGKAAVLTVVYADDATTVAVDGCAELAAGPQGATGIQGLQGATGPGYNASSTTSVAIALPKQTRVRVLKRDPWIQRGVPPATWPVVAEREPIWGGMVPFSLFSSRWISLRAVRLPNSVGNVPEILLPALSRNAEPGTLIILPFSFMNIPPVAAFTTNPVSASRAPSNND
jgi:hypothetical protein